MPPTPEISPLNIGSQPASSILSQYTVLDLTRVRAGPTCVRQLADWGANVIKIEQVATEQSATGGLGGARDSSDFQNLHRNKRSMTLNLKSADGIQVFKRLVENADIIVENYRPAVKHRLGIDYDSMRTINKRIVYASISGFGQDGPDADRPGFDQIAQGMSGLMSITGEPGQGPMRVGIAIADLCAGIFASQGVLMALLAREKTGEGQWVQSSLLQAQLFMLDFQASRWLMDGDLPAQAGNDHPTVIPTGVFQTSDGYINIACTGQEIWLRLKREFGDDRLNDQRFEEPSDRSKHRVALNQLINDTTSSQSTTDLIKRLNSAGVPCGEINNIEQAFNSAQVKHLGIARNMQSTERGATQVLGQPITMSDSSSEIKRPPPTLGEHTEEILLSAGYDTNYINALSSKGVI